MIRPPATQDQEEKIRTISVSLLAVAAVAASVLVTRARHPRAAAEELQKDAIEGAISLEAIRQAGL